MTLPNAGETDLGVTDSDSPRRRMSKDAERADKRFLSWFGRPRRRRWTAAEDAAVREAVRANRARGLTRLDSPEYVNRLGDIATRLDRTVDAVHKRAQRVGAYSYGPGPSLGE